MLFSSSVTSVTRNYIVPRSYDTITKGTPGLMFFLRNAKQWRTGLKYEVIFQTQDTTNGGNIGVADRLDTDRQDVRVRGNFEPRMAYKPIVLAAIEYTLNMGDEQIVDLMDIEFETQAKSLMVLMASNLYTGTGVGNSWDSLMTAADDGTNYGTYAGLSRTTYPTLKGYYLNNAGTLTLAKLATAFNAVEVGTEQPDLIITSQAIWTTYESLLTPTVRATYGTSGYPSMDEYGIPRGNAPTQGGGMGFSYLTYRGVPMVKDQMVPAGNVYFINKENFYFAGIDLKSPSADNDIISTNFRGSDQGVPNGVPGRVPSTRGFSFRKMKAPTDQLAYVGHLVYAGDFVSTNPRLLGRLAGAA